MSLIEKLGLNTFFAQKHDYFKFDVTTEFFENGEIAEKKLKDFKNDTIPVLSNFFLIVKYTKI